MCGNTWWGWFIIKSVKKPGKKDVEPFLKNPQTTFLVFKPFQRKQTVNPWFYLNMIFPPCGGGLKISTQGENSNKRVRVRSCLACLVQFDFFSARTTWKQECYNNQVKRLGQGRNESCYSYLHVNNPPHVTLDSCDVWLMCSPSTLFPWEVIASSNQPDFFHHHLWLETEKGEWVDPGNRKEIHVSRNQITSSALS